MRRWTPGLISKEDVEEIKQISRRDLLKWSATSGSGILSVALAGCSGSQGGQTTQGSTTTQGGQTSNQLPTGKLQFQLVNDGRNMDPAMSQAVSSGMVISNTYDRLVNFDSNGKVVPRLAAKMPKVSDDGKTYDWDLREGVMFHGGDKEMTAEDVIYSMNFIIKPPKESVVNASTYYKPWIKSVERLSKYGVRFHMKKPLGVLPLWMTRASEIVRKGTHGKINKDPGRSSGNVGAATDLTRGPKLKQEAATGPFYLEEWKSGDHITIKANDHYWMNNAPQVKEVTFQIIPEASTAVSALRSGSVDILSSVQPKDYKSLKNQPDITTAKTGGLAAECIYFDNQFGIKDAPDDPKAWEHLRKAVAYGVDRREVVDQIFYGQATPSWAPWVTATGGKWTVAPELRYNAQDWVDDPKKRKQKVMDHLKKGKRPDGFDLNVVTASSSWYSDMTQLMSDQLKQYGINMDIRTTDAAGVGKVQYSGMNKAYDSTVEDFYNALPAPEWWLLRGYSKIPNHLKWRDADQIDGKAPRTGKDTNTPWHSEITSEIEKALGATDKKTRKKHVWKGQRIAMDHMGQVNICFVSNRGAWRSSVKDYNIHAIPQLINLRNTHKNK